MDERRFKLTEGEILTHDNYDPSGDDRRWRKRQFAKLHQSYHKAVAQKYNQLFRQKGRYEANTFLRKLTEQFTTLNRLLATDDEFLESFVDNRFRELAAEAAKHTSDEKKYNALKKQLSALGVKAPIVRHNITLPGAIKRILDHSWLTRHIRKTHLLHFENCAIRAGLVHNRESPYISQASMNAYLKRIKRNRRILERTELENEMGQVFELTELVSRSVANPVNRRNELMTRLAGFDHIAQKVGHLGLFISLTCPSRMHARYKSSGDPVPNYDGTSPRQAQAYLTSLWARFRARIKHADIHIYGFRMVEPQHDGTPHWHLLLYCEQKHGLAVCSLIKELALEDSPDEKGATERRCDIKQIDWGIGSGVAYAAKYVAKNVDGEYLEKDRLDRDAKDSAIRAGVMLISGVWH